MEQRTNSLKMGKSKWRGGVNLVSTSQLCIQELRAVRLERSAEASAAFMFNLSKYETQFAFPEYTPYLICIETDLI